MIAGVWVRHAGWWPDPQPASLRQCPLRRKRQGPRGGRVGRPAEALSEPLLHLNYETFTEFREKQARYAVLEARTLWEKGVRAKPRNLVVQPIREFRRRTLELQGVRHGVFGLRLGMEMAIASFLTYRELLRLGRRGAPTE